MSKTAEEILSRLKELSNKSFVNVPGFVVSVDEAAKTAVINIDGIDYDDIRLNSVIEDENNEHSCIIPKVGSWVIITFIEGGDTDAFISSFSIVDKFLLNANEIIFNHGNLKGLVKINDLITKLNALENDINNLKQVFGSWSPVANDGGASLKISTASWSSQQLTNTILADLENEKIKQ